MRATMSSALRSTIALAASLATLALVSGCGGDDEPDDAGDVPSTSAPAAEEPGDEEPAETTEAQEPAGDAAVLIATLGEAADPDAFVITLTDEAGEAVTSIPAGDYTIEVSDPSTIHNFHLVGGSVDETTTVEEVTEVTWEVTFEAGDYRFVCDPHPNMVGEFTVT